MHQKIISIVCCVLRFGITVVLSAAIFLGAASGKPGMSLLPKYSISLLKKDGCVILGSFQPGGVVSALHRCFWRVGNNL